ncbi:hypothetical protein [uncultured Thomasclavelia sp.]|uniref:hypothetical protein n=1 Tax=uncultured Thomasclavelia sp. TaxID=3025759 RepID=UPI0025CFC562|nr:hypothetical protein [uncultured Thomasclavelia sp.]
MLAKLVNGTLRYAPKKIYIDNQLIFNPTEAQLKEQGYKEVENTESPTILTKTQTVVSSFVEQEDKIVQQWEVKAGQPDPYEVIQQIQKESIIEQVKENEDKTLGIACMTLFDVWTQDNYKVGDVRTDPDNGYPYECITEHDSISNPEWTIKNRTLWKPWHSKSVEYALPYEAPTGAHDMYKTGEFMIFTDGKVYKALQDTNFSPTDYAVAWEVQE